MESKSPLPGTDRARSAVARHCGRLEAKASADCEWEGDVVAVVAPLSGVAQVVSHGVKVVGVHREEGQEKDGEVQVEVKGEVEENQGQPHMDGMEME